MYPNATSIKELASYIGGPERVHYRFMAERIDDEFKVTRLIIGPQATWKNYNYSDLLFRAGTTVGENVAKWLLSGIITTRYKETFPLLPLNNHVDSSRHPSHSQGGLFTLSKPFTMYRASFSQAVPGQNYLLASEEAPFFFALWEAERHLLYDIAEDSVSFAAYTPEAGIYVYIEDSDAWLERIHFSLTALEIHVGGTSLIGTKLSVVGSEIKEYNSYLEQNPISIPLPNGRPNYLKIVLLRKNTLLDYFIDDRNSPSNPFKPKRTNVTFAVPEPQEKVRELIDRGEGKHIEFKAVISLSSDKLKWLKTIAAFANSEGGSLIIGVNDEDGSVVGINSMLQKYQHSIAKCKDAIDLAISDTIDPVPEYELLHADIDNQDILVINVKTAWTKCYAIYRDKEAPIYYIRRGATTRVADNNEVQELVRLKSVPLSNTTSYSNYQ